MIDFVLKDSKNLSLIMIKIILYGNEILNKKDNKITLITLNFSMLEYENRLTDTAIDLLHLINKFGKLHKLKNKVTLDFGNDQIQMIEKDKCGMYQLHFYVNLFNPLSLSKRIIEKLLNEILTADRQENERRIEQFAERNDICRG